MKESAMENKTQKTQKAQEVQKIGQTQQIFKSILGGSRESNAGI